jgi:hypothetical protein
MNSATSSELLGRYAKESISTNFMLAILHPAGMLGKVAGGGKKRHCKQNRGLDLCYLEGTLKKIRRLPLDRDMSRVIMSQTNEK